MRLIILGFLALLMGACAHGRDFARPGPDTIMLGKTTPAEITQVYGRPFSQSSGTISDDAPTTTQAPPDEFTPAKAGGSFLSYRYLRYDTSNGLVAFGGPPPPLSKVVNFTFWNNQLVAYTFTSNFEKDTSDFDDSKVQQLQKGITTRTQAEALLGEPGGRVTYPMIQIQGDEAYVYQHRNADARDTNTKFLALLFGPDGVLRNYRFSTSTSPTPPQGGGAVPVPIFIPTGKR